MRICSMVGVCVSSAVLAACGGGGSGGGGGGVNSASYTKLEDLSGSQSFSSASVRLSTDGLNPYDYSSAVNEEFETGVDIDYDIDNDMLTLTSTNGDSVTVGAADVTAQSGASGSNGFGVTRFSKVEGGKSHNINQYAPVVNGVALDYVSLGSWQRVDTVSNVTVLEQAAFGVATRSDDMPTSGTASYDTIIGGFVIGAAGHYIATPEDSTVSFDVDFASGSIDMDADLNGYLLATGGAPIETIGTLAGDGSISAGGPAFDGTLSGTLLGEASTGQFGGAFFGPDAAEIGFVWNTESASGGGAGFGAGVKQ